MKAADSRVVSVRAAETGAEDGADHGGDREGGDEAPVGQDADPGTGGEGCRAGDGDDDQGRARGVAHGQREGEDEGGDDEEAAAHAEESR